MTGRGLRGRQQARLLLCAILALDAFLVAVLFVAAPNEMRPMFDSPPSLVGLPLGSLIGAIGIAIHLAGIAWMVRILRADPEAHPSWFRATRT